MAKGKRKGWPKIGSVRIFTDEETGDKRSYIKFEENVTILVDGEEIDMNKNRTANLTTPKAELEALIERGLIKEGDIERRREQVEGTVEWLKYNIIVPPPRAD